MNKTPKALKERIKQKTSLRQRLQQLHELMDDNLWDCQVRAINNHGKSFKENRSRTLIQMATGSGKMYQLFGYNGYYY